MLKIPWTEHGGNNEFFRRIGTTSYILTIRKQQLKFLGHNEKRRFEKFNHHKTLKAWEVGESKFGSKWIAEQE